MHGIAEKGSGLEASRVGLSWGMRPNGKTFDRFCNFGAEKILSDLESHSIKPVPQLTAPARQLGLQTPAVNTTPTAETSRNVV
jgi:hypothetical protein